MRTHTSGFKNEISKFGREIDGRIYHYLHYGLATETNDNILTEDNLELITEQTDEETRELIDNELIYSIDIVKNGQLFQSLMKECDFEAKAEFRVGDMINPQLGVLVNNAYEYLDYGKFVIYSKEYVAENQTWRYVCFDKMLYSMIQYKPLDITYPCTIREYISAIADRIGLTFANASDSFTNYNQPIASELFENQSITYRDILDKLSEIVAGNFLINDNDELEIAYPAETNDEIDEENLRDVNVNFGEVFGPINKVSISETDGGYEYVAQDDVSIEANGTHQINITDNIFAFNGYTETIASAILNKIKGMTYSICDFSTTGICYYDFLDKFVVNVEENSYNCLLLNNEINVSNGIEEHIFTDKVEKSQSDIDSYKTSIMNSKEVSFKVNQQEGKIESKVEKDGVISAINQSAEQITINANKIGLTANDVLNIISGNQINLTSKNITIASTNFSVDTAGNCTANSFSSNNATITGGSLIINDEGHNFDEKIRITYVNNLNTFVKIFSDKIQLQHSNGDSAELDASQFSMFGINNGENISLYISPSGIGYYGSSQNSDYFEATQNGIKAINIAKGTCTLSSSGDTSVSFGKTMPGVPSVVITPYTQTSGVIAPKVRSISNTGFTATLGGSGFSNITCNWIAIY